MAHCKGQCRQHRLGFKRHCGALQDTLQLLLACLLDSCLCYAPSRLLPLGTASIGLLGGIGDLSIPTLQDCRGCLLSCTAELSIKLKDGQPLRNKGPLSTPLLQADTEEDCADKEGHGQEHEAVSLCADRGSLCGRRLQAHCARKCGAGLRQGSCSAGQRSRWEHGSRIQMTPLG